MKQIKLTKKNLKALENILFQADNMLHHLYAYSSSDIDSKLARQYERDADKLERDMDIINKAIEEAK